MQIRFNGIELLHCIGPDGRPLTGEKLQKFEHA